MAKLPDFTALGTSTPDASTSIPTYQGGIAEAGAAEVGRGFAKMGQDFRAAADQAQDRLNETWARDASTKLMLDMNGAAETYRKLEGMDAVAGYQAHVSAVEDMRRKALAAAPNAAAEKMLGDQSAFALARIVSGSQAYSAAQFKVGQERSHTAAASAITTTAVNQQNDPEFIQQSENAIRQSGREIAAARGLHGDEAEAFAAVEVGKFYKTLITDMAARNQAGAVALFDQVKGRMDGASQAAIAHALKASGDAGVSAAAATRAWMGGDLSGAIDRAAAAVPGSNADTLRRTAMLESSGGRDRSVSSAGARGAFQFISTTAQRYGLTNPDDDEAAANAAARLQNDNRAALKARLGRDPTEAEVYLAHQQGAAGAAALIRNPNAPAADAVGNAAIMQNGGRQGMTAGEFVRIWTDKFNGVQGPPGATNNAQPLGNKADAFSRLIGEFNAGKLTPEQFDQAATRLERLYRIDATVKQEASTQAYDEYMPNALAQPQFFNIDKMLADNRLTGTQKNALWTIVNKALKGEIDKPTQVSQAKRTELLDGIRAGSITSPDQLVDAVAHGGLSTGDYNFVRARFDEAQTENGRSLNRQTTELFGAMEKALAATPVSGLQNPYAGLDMLRYKAFAYGKIAAAQKEGAGKVAALFDPNSPDFLGSEAIVDQFKSPMDEVMRRKFQGLGGGKTPDPSGLPRAATDNAAEVPLASLGDVRAALRMGQITRERADQIAIERGWARAPDAKPAAAPGTRVSVPTTP